MGSQAWGIQSAYHLSAMGGLTPLASDWVAEGEIIGYQVCKADKADFRSEGPPKSKTSLRTPSEERKAAGSRMLSSEKESMQ